MKRAACNAVVRGCLAGAALVLCAPVALADGTAHTAALDLSPAEPAMFSGGADTPYRNDPPGTYYGDTTHPAQEETASRCPTAPDGSQRAVTGSATMGMGWSSRGGSAQYRGLDLRYCKESTDDDGDARVFSASLHVDQVDTDGMDGGMRGARQGAGPRPMHGPPPGPMPRGR